MTRRRTLTVTLTPSLLAALRDGLQPVRRVLRGDGVTPYRAAYWQSDDGQGEIVLTLPEHSHLSDDALIAEAEREAGKPGVGLDLSGGRIIVGDWRETA